MIDTVTLNPSVDYTLSIDEIQFGKTNRSCREEIHFGGKGINVSCVLAELGIPSVALGFAAGFTGRALEEDLAARGIAVRMIHLPEGVSRINIKLQSGNGEETEINGSGPAISPEALGKLIAQLNELAAGDTLVLAGSIPRSLPPDTYERMLAAVSGKNIRCVAVSYTHLTLPTILLV